jgi:hypothetical protein
MLRAIIYPTPTYHNPSSRKLWFIGGMFVRTYITLSASCIPRSPKSRHAIRLTRSRVPRPRLCDAFVPLQKWDVHVGAETLGWEPSAPYCIPCWPVYPSRAILRACGGP